MRKQFFDKGDRVWDVFKGRTGTITQVIEEDYMNEPYYEIDYDVWNKRSSLDSKVPQHLLRFLEDNDE
ncbi:MAG: hypothetical protein K9K32_00245 [Halanaerobiales bacterium]|nr:hypothetical protein [Halanaerobiales bacterium]